ncbi:MAG: response regulator transcription factor [Anaerolineaceae bacterium]|nr:response regulator transcription factor [Anaerolineaceae bacterium]
MTDIRVLIVDDQRLVREGIASLLEIQDGITVIGTAVDGQQAVVQAEDLRPDVILMDVRMPVMDGVQATERIQTQVPECKVLMLTTFDDEEYIIKSLRAGACGYLLKDTPAENLAQAIKLTYAGIYQLAPSVAGKLVGNWQKSSTEQSPEPVEHDLTERELDVLRWLATGASNREIAEKLVVSEGTVKNHVSNILSRLGLRDRVQAALYAHEHQLV